MIIIYQLWNKMKKSTTLSELFQNSIEKLKKEAESIYIAYKYFMALNSPKWTNSADLADDLSLTFQGEIKIVKNKLSPFYSPMTISDQLISSSFIQLIKLGLKSIYMKCHEINVSGYHRKMVFVFQKWIT
jgi:hypothetical protein